MIGALNKSGHCECGRAKDARRQWCEHCFEWLSPIERMEFQAKVQIVRECVRKLQAEIDARQAAAAMVKK